MEEKRMIGSRLREIIPGAAGEKSPRVLYDAIETFAPGLLKRPELVDGIRKYLFGGFDTSGPALKRQELYRRLKAASPTDNHEDLDVFLTILDGMSAAMEYYKLLTPEGLDHFLQAHKDTFGYRLFGGPDGLTNAYNGGTIP